MNLNSVLGDLKGKYERLYYYITKKCNFSVMNTQYDIVEEWYMVYYELLNFGVSLILLYLDDLKTFRFFFVVSKQYRSEYFPPKYYINFPKLMCTWLLKKRVFNKKYLPSQINEKIFHTLIKKIWAHASSNFFFVILIFKGEQSYFLFVSKH